MISGIWQQLPLNKCFKQIRKSTVRHGNFPWHSWKPYWSEVFINNHYHFLWGWIRTGLIWLFARTGKLTCFNSLKWDPAMADSHYMQMMEGFFLHYLLVTTGGHGVKVILQTMKDWLWMTASTSGLHIALFRRRLGQWNTLFTELCAQNLLAALARRNSCYCFCGMKSLDANQLWHEVEDRAVTALDRSFSVRTLG